MGETKQEHMTVDQWYSTGKHIPIDNLRVFCKREGAGKTLVCIHGFPSSSWDFQMVWPGLTEHFDVIAADLIGLGKSSKPKKSLDIEFQADILEQVFIDQDVKEAHILAHDIGNTVAQELLARQREGASKINWLTCSFLNGGLFPESHKPLFIQKLLISPLGAVFMNFMTESSFKKNMTQVFSASHPPDEEFLNETWKLIQLDGGLHMIPRLIRYMQERVHKRERWVMPLIQSIIPHQLIDGVEDPVSGIQLVERYQELIPESTVIQINNSGHYPHLETPKQVIEAVVNLTTRMV